MALAACGGDGGTDVTTTTGSLEIKTSTTSSPATGYNVAVDGGPTNPLQHARRNLILPLHGKRSCPIGVGSPSLSLSSVGVKMKLPLVLAIAPAVAFLVVSCRDSSTEPEAAGGPQQQAIPECWR